MPGCGIYLHIPFCVRKCLYCSFFSVVGGKEVFARYCRALLKQMRQFAGSAGLEQYSPRTVFFGGGTPSVLSASHLVQLLHACRQCFRLPGDSTEISLEVNPATVNRDDLEQLAEAGFSRLSIGVQSFVDAELQVLGRPHTAAEARETFLMARRAGFDNISIDLMYGLPGQTVCSWEDSLATALQLAPDHLSVYELTIEEDTVFAHLQEEDRLHLPEEEEILHMMRLTLQETAKTGLHRYEISNYARSGRECLHNINYWENGSYAGIGAGAVSCLAGCRFAAVADVEEFCRRIETGESVVRESEKLGREARFRESVVMGLRMTRGVSINSLQRRFGLNAEEYYGEVLRRLQRDNLLTGGDGFLRLTDRGFLLANRVMAELV